MKKSESFQALTIKFAKYQRLNFVKLTNLSLTNEPTCYKNPANVNFIGLVTNYKK